MVEITEIQEEQVVILELRGEIDASSSIELDQAIAKAIESNSKNIFINSAGLEYISSAGLGVFMSYIEVMKEKGVEFIIYGLNPKVKNVFQILGLDQLVKITEDKASALRLANEV